ncbi:IclR family transcriptional regulator [Variovorax sp. J22P271]|uniref:IclR family transcriptional regulator n=1 Tax=Variovorax davisae TaxID=3053515 RepID=UPI00257808E4|nr:IclR family transcriptional regulator [Variovorax sp. J22P271]MDM0032465.1 IclR family transcriptional regulator [Variovorax sp. J22P271]
MSETPRDSMYVTALARGIEVLRCFTPERPELGTSEIARLTGLPQPTVYRLCYTLSDLGCLMPGRSPDKLRVAPGVLSLGHAAVTHGGIADLAHPMMNTLANEFDASVSLGARDRTSMVIVQRSEAPGIVNVNLHIGSALDLANSSLGWAWLAAINDEARKDALEPIKRVGGDRWRKAQNHVKIALSEYERGGFVLNLGKSHPDINAIGVPVISPSRIRVMALTCGGVRTSMTRERLENDVAPRLVSLAQQLSLALGP